MSTQPVEIKNTGWLLVLAACWFSTLKSCSDLSSIDVSRRSVRDEIRSLRQEVNAMRPASEGTLDAMVSAAIQQRLKMQPEAIAAKDQEVAQRKETATLSVEEFAWITAAIRVEEATNRFLQSQQ